VGELAEFGSAIIQLTMPLDRRHRRCPTNPTISTTILACAHTTFNLVSSKRAALDTLFMLNAHLKKSPRYAMLKDEPHYEIVWIGVHVFVW
jgi:hypothetical protein